MACDGSSAGCRLGLYTIRPPVASCGNCVLPQLAAFMYGNIHEEKAIGKGEFGNRREELQMRTQHASISSSHYDRAVLDNGRTNAIHYHAEIKAAGGWPTYVGDYYAEFYYTFTGTMS